MTMLLHELLTRSAGSAPQDVAVIEPAASITYGALERRAHGVAAALIQAGVRRGDRVVLALPNSIEFVASYFGILHAGAGNFAMPRCRRSIHPPPIIIPSTNSRSATHRSRWRRS